MPDAADRPNVLLVLSDQHRPDVLGHLNDAANTPNLDRLAARGVRFDEAYTTSPLCGPARSSLVSGVYPHDNNCVWGDTDPADWTFMQALQDAGYYTGHVGKQHHCDPPEVDSDDARDLEPYMRERGFDYVHQTPGTGPGDVPDGYLKDYWREHGLYETYVEDYDRRWNESGHWPSPLPFEHHQDSYIGRRAVEFVEGYDREAPFFLNVGFGGPHDPMDPPAELFEHYDPAEMPDRLHPDDDVFGDWMPEDARETAEHVAMAGEPQGYWRPGLDDEYWREWRAYYYAKVELIDHWVGELLDALEAAGELEDTVVVYTTDHGEMAGDHGILTKRMFYDQSVRIPFLVSGPGFAEGTSTDALVEWIDLGPTFLDVADGPEARSFGESLVPTLEDPDRDTERDYVFSIVEGHNYEHKAMVATREYKYAVSTDGTGYLLFDRRADPQERRNLVGHPDYADAERAMRDRLLSHYQRTAIAFRRRDGEDVIRYPEDVRD